MFVLSFVRACKDALQYLQYTLLSLIVSSENSA